MTIESDYNNSDIYNIYIYMYVNKIIYKIGMGNYSINRENRDNLASNNRIVTIFLVFNYRKSQ